MSREKTGVREISFSSALRRLREALPGDLSQDDMARLCGFKVGTYRQWEQGSRKPSGSHLIAILNAVPREFACRLVAELGASLCDPAISKSRAYNLAAEGLSVIREASESGNRAAARVLDDLADRIVRLAGDFTAGLDNRK